MFLASPHEECRLKIRYLMIAQFLPADYAGWSDSTKEISKFRNERRVFFYQPAVHLPQNPQKFKLINEIGGLLGFGKTQSVTKIKFDR